MLSVGAGEDACRLIERIIVGGTQYEPQSPAPNTALAIYQHAKAATDLLDASPIRFVLEVDARRSTVAPMHAFRMNQQAGEVPGWEIDKAGAGVGDGIALEDLERRVGHPQMEEPAADVQLDHMARQSQESADAGSKAEEAKPTEPHSQASPSPQPEPLRTPPSNAHPGPNHDDLRREFQLTISRSHLNHQAYIERQAYYGPFIPDMRSIMAEDLESRVPLKGMADCKLGKEEVPLRIRQRRKERDAERAWVGLKGLWEMGQREKERLGSPEK